MGNRAPVQFVVAGGPVVLNETDDVYPIRSNAAITVDNGIQLPPSFEREITLVNLNNSSRSIAIDQSTDISRCNVGGVLRGNGASYKLACQGGRKGLWNFVGGYPQNPVIVASQVREETALDNHPSVTTVSQEIVPNTLSSTGITNVLIEHVNGGAGVGAGAGNIEINAAGGAVNFGDDANTGAINIATVEGGTDIAIGDTSTVGTLIYNFQHVSGAAAQTAVTNTTITAAQGGFTYFVNPSAGDVTMTLPDATSTVLGTHYHFYRAAGDNGGNDMIIDGSTGPGGFRGFVYANGALVNAGGNDVLNMGGAGSVANDWAEVSLVESGVWWLHGYKQSGTVTIT
jgi:hypothetical protein